MTDRVEHCDCVKRMRLQFSNTDRYDYAIVNAVDESLPDWLTSHLVQVVCTTCGEEFYAGKVGELLMSIHTSATEERDEARADVRKLRDALGESISHQPCGREGCRQCQPFVDTEHYEDRQ